jgi:hypothetical protein
MHCEVARQSATKWPAIQHDLREISLSPCGTVRRYFVASNALSGFGVVRGRFLDLHVHATPFLPNELSLVALGSKISAHIFLRLFFPPRQLIAYGGGSWSQTAYTDAVGEVLELLASVAYVPPPGFIPGVFC